MRCEIAKAVIITQCDKHSGGGTRGSPAPASGAGRLHKGRDVALFFQVSVVV